MESVGCVQQVRRPEAGSWGVTLSKIAPQSGDHRRAGSRKNKNNDSKDNNNKNKRKGKSIADKEEEED